MVKCQDCKHSFRRIAELAHWGSGYEYRCRLNWVAPRIEFDPVLGDKKIVGKFETCHMTRSKYSEICGDTGKLWTPKKSINFFTYLKRV